MKLTKISEDKKALKITFLMKGSSEVFANTIRRMIVEEVPTLAVEDLEIKDNSSALYDEMLGLRLGLAPVKTDLSSYRLPKNQEEVDERSAQCTLQIRLKAGKKGYVYCEEAQSTDPKCTFAIPKLPIVKLLAKQKVDVTMYAVMGQGKEHIKWSPGWAFYQRAAELKVGKVKDAKAIADKSTDGVLSIKAGKLHVNENKAYKSQLLEYYASLDDGIKVEETQDLVFSLEGWGQLGCKEMLTTAADMLVEKAQMLESAL